MSFSFGPSSTQQSLYSSSGPSQSSTFADLGAFSSGTFGPDAAALDANSPELFKENLKVVHTHVEHIRSLVHAALIGIQKAYGSGVNATQTAATLQDLKQAIADLQALLVTSGVGALPLLPPGADPPTEAQILEQTTKAFNETWALRARHQDAAAMVANLLQAPDLPVTRS
ncbi:hypothetical protein K488DRAFT_84279 [Vararia minispora EC-137]|uniref:Uncharacterized protein n=1 Tax=Vararia minispora EC-137 TaxID=1314806 RepID=A0ACB8QRK0_9AGAM|nr:hypothetical protein K488DRAFT_84279 [Vararia minispora EC-137]